MRRFECSYPTRARVRDGGTVDFDPAHDASHRRLLDRMIARYKSDHPEAADAVLDTIDADRHVAVLIDRTVASVDRADDGTLTVNLSAEHSRPNRGGEVRSVYESRHPGYSLVEFHPWQGRAVLARLTDAQRAARAAIAAELHVDDWDIRVTPTPEGGWTVTPDEQLQWQDSAMQPRLDKACLAVGGPGWWHGRDETGRIILHPGTPPVFLDAHPYPFDLLTDPDIRDHTPVGVRLPRTGGDPYETVRVDWTQSSFLLVGGEGGTGKSVFVNTLLAAIVASRARLTIVDLENKATDYYWLRPWVGIHEWGCTGSLSAVGVLNRLVAEIEHGERAKAWRDNAWQNWLDIPRWAKEKYPLHYIVVDEYSSLVDRAKDLTNPPNPEKVPPSVIERQVEGVMQSGIRADVQRLLRTARAQGYRMIVISQTISERSGLGPTIRDLFGHHVVMGANPSAAICAAAFHDNASMPPVPDYLKEGRAAKGIGRAELAGERGLVFKSFWAGHDGMGDTEALGRTLADIVGLPQGIDRDAYLDTLRHHGEDDPVDAAFMNMLTDRITLPHAQALATDPFLADLHARLDESRANFGTPPTPDPDTPAPAADPPAAREGAFMDAAALARAMRG